MRRGVSSPESGEFMPERSQGASPEEFDLSSSEPSPEERMRLLDMMDEIDGVSAEVPAVGDAERASRAVEAVERTKAISRPMADAAIKGIYQEISEERDRWTGPRRAASPMSRVATARRRRS